MPRYVVQLEQDHRRAWQKQVDADSPEEAARLAQSDVEADESLVELGYREIEGDAQCLEVCAVLEPGGAIALDYDETRAAVGDLLEP